MGFIMGEMSFCHSTNSVITTTTTILWPFVQDYLGEPAPEETFTSHTYPDHQSLSASSILYDP